MKGRKPTPSALKVIRGTNQPVRMNKKEIQPGKVSKMPPPPKWFSALAKKIYKSKSKELMALGIMTSLDIDMFLLYCNEYAIYIETSEFINQVPTKSSMAEASELVFNRAVRKNQRAWERAKSIAVEFGFTPSSRSKVTQMHKDENPEDKDFD